MCEEEIKKAPKNIRYAYKGVLSVNEMEQVYRHYDCLLHPTHSENYGHVIVEALCHDCPVVISRGTTPWDDVEKVNAGRICNLSSEQEFINALEDIAHMDNNEYHKMIEGISKYVIKFNFSELRRDYVKMISSVIESK